jgi:transcriptional regulator with PAS, ATPase and Fis domain
VALVANETIDDVSSVAESATATPIIVMVATGTTPVGRVYQVIGPVALGRQITYGKHVEEVEDDKMSREHASVRFERGTWRIFDQGSKNGTFVDGERITGEVTRTSDTVVRLGATVFILVRNGSGYTDTFGGNGEHVIGPELSRAYDNIRRNANSKTLLLHGENGSGKELAARLFHDSGPRRDGPFIAVNCATIQPNLAEAQLFGSRKGAFTEARDAPGYIQSAHQGTLFLDEIAELSPDVQAKLLRVMEKREVTPLGASAPIAVEVGVVAATHRELRAAVATKAFREDLFYRISHDCTVHLPALRARKVDIARLVVRAIAAVDRSLEAHSKLIETCCHRPWPGNVRELLGAVTQAARRKQADEDRKSKSVRPEHLPEHAGEYIVGADHDTATDRPRAKTGGEITRDEIIAALDKEKCNVAAAARRLGVHRTQLYREMEKHGIPRGRNGVGNHDDDGDD